jgi:predicted dehydrogenase
MAERTLRWGVLGCADIALRRLIPAMQAAPSCTVVAIGSRELARAQAAAAELEIPHAFGSYADVLASPDVDAIYIPLPNTLHAEWTIAAARAGKHVLCEKPMATTAADAEQMVAACRAAGVRFMEAFMYHSHPQHARVRELLAAQAIGPLRVMRSSFCVRMARPADDIRYQASLGGGALFDVGVYALDAVRWYLGDPHANSGEVVRSAEGIDVSAAAALRFADDVLAVATCSFVANGGGTYELLGEQGRITAHQSFAMAPDATPRVSWTTPAGSFEETFPVVDQYALMVEAFARGVLDDTPLPIADDAGIGTIALIESLLRGT